MAADAAAQLMQLRQPSARRARGMTVAFGTSTPTSITVVDTRTCVSPREREYDGPSFCFSRPCSSAALYSGNTSA